MQSPLTDCFSLSCIQSVRKSCWLHLENISQIFPLLIPATATILVHAILTAWRIASTFIPTVYFYHQSQEASLMLLKNKAGYITPLIKMHQTLPCSYRITPKASCCSGRTNMLILHLCSFSDLDANMFSLTHSSPASFTSCWSSYISGKGSRAFARPFLCLQHSSPRYQLGFLLCFIQISAQRSLDQKRLL